MKKIKITLLVPDKYAKSFFTEGKTNAKFVNTHNNYPVSIKHPQRTSMEKGKYS